MMLLQRREVGLGLCYRECEVRRLKHELERLKQER
jgi:hypothetical protein